MTANTVLLGSLALAWVDMALLSAFRDTPFAPLLGLLMVLAMWVAFMAAFKSE